MKLAFGFSYSFFLFCFPIWSLHLSEAVVLLAVICTSFRNTFYCALGAAAALPFVFIVPLEEN